MSKPMADVAEIARGLTKAQRDMLDWFAAHPSWCVGTRAGDWRDRPELHRMGLLDWKVSRGENLYRITHFGRAVRAHLTQEQPR